MRGSLLLIVALVFWISGANAQNKSLFDRSIVHEIRVTFPASNWKDVLDSLRTLGEGMAVAGAQIDGASFPQVGLNYRNVEGYQMGGERNSLLLDIAHVDPTANHQGYKKLLLSNALRDPSMVREMLSFEILRRYLPAPETAYCKLYINGTYRGVFVMIQFMDLEFYKQKAGIDPKTIAVPKFKVCEESELPKGCKKNLHGSLELDASAACMPCNWNLSRGENLNGLYEFTKQLSKDIKNIDKYLNVDQTLWMLAFNNVTVNLSSYSGSRSMNYILVQDQHNKWHPFPVDFNLSFGSFKNIGKGSDLSNKDLESLDPLLHADNPTRPLLAQLLKDPVRKKTYLHHVRTLLEDFFLAKDYEKIAMQYRSLIATDMQNDPFREYNGKEFENALSNTTGSVTKIPGLVAFMNDRARFLKKHAALSVIGPKISEINFVKREKLAKDSIGLFKISAVVDKLPKQVKLLYRFASDQPYQSIVMKDDGRNNDGSARDGVYGITVDPKGHDQMEYYIMAENNALVSFEPVSFQLKPLKVTLKELN